MRWLLIIGLLAVVVGCSTPVSCDDRDRDGGIGGTGTCEREEPEAVLAALEYPGTAALVQFP